MSAEGKQSPIAEAVASSAVAFSQLSLEDAGPIAYSVGAPDPLHFLLCPNTTATDLYTEISAPGGAKGDSGTDIRFPTDLVIQPSSKTKGRPAVIDMEVRARLRSGYGFLPYLLVPRSSIGKTPLGLANSIGIIDRGYLGTLKVAIRNFSDEPFEVKRGDSLFQLVLPGLQPVPVRLAKPGHAYFAEDASLRGSGGLGSTGAAGTGAPKEK